MLVFVVGINAEEEWDVVYMRRMVSVAVSRKKVAVDAVSTVIKGIFQ